MTSASLKHWTIGLLFVSIICIDLFAPCTFAAESKKSGNAVADGKTGETKVKCKKHIEEALKKYWDQEKGEYVTKEQLTRKLADSVVDIEDDDDDDNEDDTQEDNVTVEDVKKSTGKDDDTVEDKTEEDDDDDADDEEDDVSDEEDDGADEDETTETVEDVTVEEPEPPKKMIGRLDAKKDTPVKVTTTTTTTTAKPMIGRLPSTPRTTTTTSTTTTTTPAPKTTVKRATTTVAPKKTTTVKTTTAAPTKLMKGRLPPKTTPAPVVEEESEEDANSLEEYKSRSQIEDILKLYEIGTKEDTEEQNLITSTFKDLKRIYEASIKPLETLYKYKFISNRQITDAEIFSKPMVLFLGSKSSGKTSLVNYLLGLDSTPWQIRTGLTAAPPHFTIVEYGDQFTKLSPMEISADFAFSNLQQFGQHFVESHLEAFRMPLSILQKITIVDSPGLVDGNLNKAPEPGKSIDSEVYQWFVDRADIIFICIESSQVQVTQALKDLLEQLKGRDVRFIITKAESLSQTQAVMLIGQLLWSLSPLMPIDRPPQVYALTTIPQEEFNPFLDQQEQEWLQDLGTLITGVSRVESRASAIRRHAVRVRNHAKVIDCYIGAYNRRKPIFSFGGSGKKLAQDITENPHNYNIFKGVLAGITQNVSRYDLPDPDVYREFFKVNHLLDFKQLSATCSFFAGCPIDKLDIAIAYKIPDLVSKYKKATKSLKKNKSTGGGGKKK